MRRLSAPTCFCFLEPRTGFSDLSVNGLVSLCEADDWPAAQQQIVKSVELRYDIQGPELSC
jgi:hypothetical protein